MMISYSSRGTWLTGLSLLCLVAMGLRSVDAWSTNCEHQCWVSSRSWHPTMKSRSKLPTKSWSQLNNSDESSGESRTSKEEDDPERQPLPRPVSDAIRTNQEELMEQLSLSGADRIAAMGIPERAKRAMLAEAVEDRIFELTDVLEKLVDQSSGGALVDEANREKAVQVAQQTKALQIQYEELVSGKPSSMLQNLESIMGGTDSGSSSSNSK